MNNITMSVEDYLEAIYVLGVSGEVKSTDVADMLCVSRPAVARALPELIQKGYVQKKAYGKITLTDEGKSIAESIYSRHTLIKSFLLSIGVSEATAAKDCCKLEHFVSEETLTKLREFMQNRE